MHASIGEQDQRIKRLVGLYVSGEVRREHFQSLKADYEEVKLSKLEALKALEEDAKDSASYWTSPRDPRQPSGVLDQPG